MDDLAALLTRLTRRLVEAERPILERHGLTMWEYVALTQVAAGEQPTQQRLASEIGYDKTRLIALLDGLEKRGLLTREPDPADRRARRVALTHKGRRTFERTQAAIQAMEAELVPEPQLRALRATLDALEAERLPAAQLRALRDALGRGR